MIRRVVTQSNQEHYREAIIEVANDLEALELELSVLHMRQRHGPQYGSAYAVSLIALTA